MDQKDEGKLVPSSSRLLKDFQIEQVLGSGGFGIVCKVIHILDQKPYAIKIIPSQYISQNEVIILASMSHPNVVNYSTSWNDNLRKLDLEKVEQTAVRYRAECLFSRNQPSVEILCIQMELCSQDLREWLNKQTQVNQGTSMNIFQQICSGLNYIHKMGLIHRDLKPENIFFSAVGQNKVKIGDFGIAAIHFTKASVAPHSRRAGTDLYLAPEQKSSHYGPTADIHALGKILYELFDPSLRSYGQLREAFRQLEDNRILPETIRSKWPNVAKLVLDLASHNPDERPTFSAIKHAVKHIMLNQKTDRKELNLINDNEVPVKLIHPRRKPIAGLNINNEEFQVKVENKMDEDKLSATLLDSDHPPKLHPESGIKDGLVANRSKQLPPRGGIKQRHDSSASHQLPLSPPKSTLKQKSAPYEPNHLPQLSPKGGVKQKPSANDPNHVDSKQNKLPPLPPKGRVKQKPEDKEPNQLPPLPPKSGTKQKPAANVANLLRPQLPVKGGIKQNLEANEPVQLPQLPPKGGIKQNPVVNEPNQVQKLLSRNAIKDNHGGQMKDKLPSGKQVEQDALTCAKCKRLIRQTVVEALNQIRPDHNFCCSQCSKPIRDLAFYRHYDGNVYCNKDYVNVDSLTCCVCNKSFTGQTNSVGNNSNRVQAWILKKLLSFTRKVRRLPISLPKPVLVDGKVYCNEDCLKSVRPKCENCGKRIDTNHVKVKDKDWHRECLICSVCSDLTAAGYKMLN